MTGSRILAGQRALVTGASRGLGAAIARAFAEAGSDVALVGRNREKLEAVTAEVCSHGVRGEAFLADIRSEEAVAGLHEQVRGRMGSVDILVNNAGINIRKPVFELALNDWHEVIETNLTSVFLLCRAFGPAMCDQGFGRMINVASMLSHISLPGRSPYAASKAGLLGFTRTLALELGGSGVTVNCLSPGPFATDLNAPLIKNRKVNEEFLRNIPVGRWGDPEEVGPLAVYLASAASAFVTGTDFVIDGGWTAQ